MKELNEMLRKYNASDHTQLHISYVRGIMSAEDAATFKELFMSPQNIATARLILATEKLEDLIELVRDKIK